LNTRRNLVSQSYLFVNKHKSSGKEKPLTTTAISAMFNRTVRTLNEKGVLDFKERKGKPAELRLYNLCKFFNRGAAPAGHKQGVVDNYISKDVEHHRKLYTEKAMPFLRIETPQPTETEKTITELREQIAEKDRIISAMDARLSLVEKLNDPEQLEETIRRIIKKVKH